MNRKTELPAWTPILGFSAAMWICSAFALTWFQDMEGKAILATAAIAIAMGALCASIAMRSQGALSAVMLMGCCVGVVIASSSAGELHEASMHAEESGRISGYVRVLEDSRMGDFGPWCLARACLEDGTSVKVRVNLPEGTRAFCWQKMLVSAGVDKPSEASVDYYWRNGCVGSVSPSVVTVSNPKGLMGIVFKLRMGGIELWSGAHEQFGCRYDEANALVQAMLLGSREELFASDLYLDVKAVGLAHMVAVSGAHLVIVTGFLASMLRLMRLPKVVCMPVQAAFTVAFVAFSGMPVSAIRAAAMSICSSSAFFAKRRASSVNAVSICSALMMVNDPSLSLSVSLALSCCASLGIALLAKPLSHWLDAAFREHARPVSETMGLTLSANALTLGISVPMFHQIPLIAPLSNLIATPAFASIMALGIIGMVISAPMRGSTIFLLPTLQVAQAFCDAVHILARFPFACIAADAGIVTTVLVSAGIVAFVIRFKLQPNARVGSIALAFVSWVVVITLFVMPRVHGNEVIMLDVGQGDAIVYRSGSHAILIDTGTDDGAVLAGLARHHVRHLDAAVISHPDDDHCGSLPAVLSSLHVDRVFVARDLLSCPCSNCKRLRSALREREVEGLRAGDRFSFGRFQAKVLSPRSFEEEGGNADSLVIALNVDCDDDGISDWKVLATGDAEADVLESLARQDAFDEIDILKVPHHGSSGGLDDNLMSLLSPDIALVSVGSSNRYGHPHQDTLDLLDEHGCQVFRTDICGDVVCRLTDRTCKVRTVR